MSSQPRNPRTCVTATCARRDPRVDKISKGAPVWPPGGVTASAVVAFDFREHDLSVEERAEGRFGSDGASFSQKGIATIGLYTGSGGPKSESQASLFGGSAGCPYDPCYHRACDTIENINRDVLEQNTRALVRALNAASIAAKR